jgi:hypothetical protein
LISPLRVLRRPLRLAPGRWPVAAFPHPEHPAPFPELPTAMALSAMASPDPSPLPPLAGQGAASTADGTSAARAVRVTNPVALWLSGVVKVVVVL